MLALVVRGSFLESRRNDTLQRLLGLQSQTFVHQPVAFTRLHQQIHEKAEIVVQVSDRVTIELRLEEECPGLFRDCDLGNIHGIRISCPCLVASCSGSGNNPNQII